MSATFDIEAGTRHTVVKPPTPYTGRVAKAVIKFVKKFVRGSSDTLLTETLPEVSLD